MANELIEDLTWRGLIAQSSNLETLNEHLNSGSRTLYCGFDPTADSLHIGSLVPLLVLKRFQNFGHRPILLVGGATGLIGDPSFKDDERSLNSEDVVSSWVESIKQQAQPYLEFSGNNAAIAVNNLDWTREMDVISFLRDVGKHFSVNAMIQRDSVRNRLERAEQGISYTEFSYMLLQGMDYLELARRHDCTLQIGGKDQWGNIVSGVDLVRRNLAKEVHALTLPLVTKADGTKFGKTEGGAIWLSPEKTSPYSFYQFWLNAADADVGNFLKLFTFLSRQEIEELEQATLETPEQRQGQRRLAECVTALVHGDAAVSSAQRISASLFGGGHALGDLTLADLSQLQQDGMSCSVVSEGEGLLNVLVAAGLAKSTGDARKLIKGNGVRLNGEVQQDHAAVINFAESLHGKYFLLRRGKKAYHLLVKSA